MEINSLKNLKKNGRVFELYAEVIVNNNPYAVYAFPCTERHNMRLDLVSFDIYNNTEQCDVLSNVNGLMNPLCVQSGDTIFFVDEKNLDKVRSDAAVIAAVIDSVKTANKGKSFKSDENRANDSSNRKKTEQAKAFVPPNIIQTNTTNIEYSEGEIRLKPNF